jgi:hypothetical protein
MNTKLVPALLLLALAACAQQSPQPAQDTPATTNLAVAEPASPSAAAPALAPSDAQVAPGRWNVERVRSDLLGASDEDRAAAAMFYHGYLAAKAGMHIIDVSKIDSDVNKVMSKCAASPNLTVPRAYRQALRLRASSH